MSDLSLLMDMGFTQQKAERALSVTGNKGVEPAMEWLLAHADEIESTPEVTYNEGEGLNKGMDDNAGEETTKMDTLDDELASQAKSLQCDECNKKFRTDSEVEFHAVKTGHQSFSESSEEVKPLSEEEKREQLKKVESIIRQRRMEKAEQEKQEALAKEKSRRKTGQEITHLRQKMQEEEIKQLAELKRREKLEAKIARQRVLEEIERDKQARREKFGTRDLNTSATSPTTPPVQQIAATAPTPTYDECRIQIRLTNGDCLTHTFNAKEELAAVRLFVQMNRTDGSGPFSLMTSFPKKVFTDEEMNASLEALGLVPSAVLIMKKE